MSTLGGYRGAWGGYLRLKSQRQLWTVRFSVLIWRWPSCHFGERSSVKRSTLMVRRRWKPACRCWSGFAERAVEVRRKTAATWLAHDAAAAARGSLATTCWHVTTSNTRTVANQQLDNIRRSALICCSQTLQIYHAFSRFACSHIRHV